MRWLVFAAACALVASACSLDMSGIGATASVDDGGMSIPPGDDASSIDDSETPGSDGPSSSDGPVTTDSSDGAVHLEASPDDGATDAPVMEAGIPTVCDEDGDGYKAMTPGCGGTDCCDTDAHVHPGQTAFFTTAGACGSFDYDCSGKITPEYGAASCSWSSFSCSGQGFAAPIPSCGDFGMFTSCSIPWYDPFTCDGSDAPQAQACN